MPLTLDRIEALAPDQASLAAARKLLKSAFWPTLAEDEGLIWGEHTHEREINSDAENTVLTCASRLGLNMEFADDISGVLKWPLAYAVTVQ